MRASPRGTVHAEALLSDICDNVTSASALVRCELQQSAQLPLRVAAKGVSLPLGLALGSPIFPSGCEGKLGVALESLQGLRDLT